MKKLVEKQAGILIKLYELDCSIEEFKEIANWDHICWFKTLSEDFIREFKNCVRWRYISLKQELSLDFIREFKNRIEIWALLENKNTLEEIKQKIRDNTFFPKIVILYPENNFSLIDVE